jgi:hypothetical protein
MAIRRTLVLHGPVLLAAFCVSGCGQGDEGGSEAGSVWDDTVEVAILEPFQGKWQFDKEQTLAEWRRQGMSDEEIDNLRELYRSMAKIEVPTGVQQALGAAGVDPNEAVKSMGTIHPDLTVQGHVAISDGFVSSEYRLFGIHQHDQYLCGKAWHHEDRFDYGDMSKCYVKLAIEGDEFHLQVMMQDGWPENDDPDLREETPILAAPDSACDADAPAPSDWTTYVFVRPPDG